MDEHLKTIAARATTVKACLFLVFLLGHFLTEHNFDSIMVVINALIIGGILLVERTLRMVFETEINRLNASLTKERKVNVRRERDLEFKNKELYQQSRFLKFSNDHFKKYIKEEKNRFQSLKEQFSELQETANSVHEFVDIIQSESQASREDLLSIREDLIHIQEDIRETTSFLKKKGETTASNDTLPANADGYDDMIVIGDEVYNILND